MQISRQRYTPNDVGPSPLEWSAPQLSQVSELITNGFVGTASPFYTDESGVPYLYGSNIRPNRIELSGVRYITHEFHEQEAKTSLKCGDLLMVQSGHIGETAVVPKELEGANCHALIVTRPRKDLVHPDYLSHYINSEIGRARLKGLEVGSTILHINTKDLKKFRVLLPPLSEQKKIARILSTWDQASNTVEKLISNSKQQKTALAQSLLDGTKRLPGFADPWNYQRASDIFSPISTRNNSANEVLLAVTQDQGILPRSLLERRVVMPEGDTTSYKLVHPGNFVISLRSFQGGLEHSKFRGIVSPAYTVIAAKKDISSDFYRHYFKSYNFIGHLAVAVVGIRDGKQISYGDFSFLKLPCPPIPEQEKIAEILNIADREIEILQEKLACINKERKALVQQLLTGKRRVMIDKLEFA